MKRIVNIKKFGGLVNACNEVEQALRNGYAKAEFFRSSSSGSNKFFNIKLVDNKIEVVRPGFTLKTWGASGTTLLKTMKKLLKEDLILAAEIAHQTGSFHVYKG